jgi:hypothetical protein
MKPAGPSADNNSLATGEDLLEVSGEWLRGAGPAIGEATIPIVRTDVRPASPGEAQDGMIAGVTAREAFYGEADGSSIGHPLAVTSQVR